MDLTNKLLSLPTYLLLALMFLFFMLIGILITWLFRKYFRVSIMNAHNEATGYIFSVVAGFYALILAFVVFQALDGYNSVQRDADIEGSLAKSLYRQIKYYPESSASSALETDYIRYVNLVTNDEYPKMSRLQKSEETVQAFGVLFEKIEQLKSEDYNLQNKAWIMQEQLNELAKYRNLRTLAGDSEIPIIMWIPLILGWVITMAFAAMLNVENQRYHIFINGMMGAFTGLIFFLIILLDHPFTGIMKVNPTTYQQILDMEKQHQK